MAPSGRGVLLSSDTIHANPDRATVTFLRSYPNRIPLSPTVVERITSAAEQLAFDRLYDNFARSIDREASAAVRRSADRYIAWAAATTTTSPERSPPDIDARADSDYDRREREAAMTAIDHTQQPAAQSVHRPPNPVRFAHDWLRRHDPGYGALRRAGRTALIMPAMLALGTKVIGNPLVATFAAFGSFAMLLLVDFTGPIQDRVRAQALLGVACAVLISLGTLASQTTWISVVGMAIVAFVVLFSAVVSSVMASATTSLLLAYILPVSLPGPASRDPGPGRRLGHGGGSLGDRDRGPVAGGDP